MARIKSYLIICFVLGAMVLTGLPSAWAHDATVGILNQIEFSGVGENFAIEYQHGDQDPYKGWVNVLVTNTGTEAWGDFHFNIFQVSGSVENVHFLGASMTDYLNQPGLDPTSSQILDDWTIDNVTVGATIDLLFYGDPVLPGEDASFSVYTDNTQDMVSFFGTAFYPTPVPIPGAALLMASGLLGLSGVRKKIKK